jgi:hypothetical protein
VQHGAVLGDVELRAAEHRVDLLREMCELRRSEEVVQDGVVQPVLGEVEVDAAGPNAHPVSARRVVLENVAQRPAFQSTGMAAQDVLGQQRSGLSRVMCVGGGVAVTV